MQKTKQNKTACLQVYHFKHLQNIFKTFVTLLQEIQYQCYPSNFSGEAIFEINIESPCRNTTNTCYLCRCILLRQNQCSSQLQSRTLKLLDSLLKQPELASEEQSIPWFMYKDYAASCVLLLKVLTLQLQCIQFEIFMRDYK